MPPKRRKIRRFTFRGFEEEEIINMAHEDLFKLFGSRMRRKLQRSNGIKRPYLKLLDRIKQSKSDLKAGEKATMVRTRLRNAIVLPEMIGAVVGVYNGKEYHPVEVKFNMIGRYFAEFAITYKHARHTKTGKGATKSSKHISKT